MSGFSSGRDRRKKLGEISSVASALRADCGTSDAPDLCDSILSRVEVSRPFLSSATRRAIWVGRAGLGGAVAVMVLGACLAWRYWPEKMELVARPAPLSAVMDSVEAQATTQLVSLQTIGPEARKGANELVATMAMKIEPRCAKGMCGPTMPTFEAISRGVVIEPVCLNAARCSGSSKYKAGAPAQSVIECGAAPARMMVLVDAPVRPGSLIDEQGLDAGLGPK